MAQFKRREKISRDENENFGDLQRIQSSVLSDKRQRKRREPERDEIFIGTGICEPVYDYEKIGRVGEGTYGLVYKARHRHTGDVVAMKRVLFHNEASNGFPITSLREIRLLKKLKHPNVVRLLDVVAGSQRSGIFLCFEFCQTDLASVLDSYSRRFSRSIRGSKEKENSFTSSSISAMHHRGTNSYFTEAQVKSIMQQLLRAVKHIHSHWIIHRDIKMSNLLYHYGILKLADFGLAREYAAPAAPGTMTTKVVTLWYRAPELLFGATEYGPAIDMWAVGCIFAELLYGQPFFDGTNEPDQIQKILQVLGTPSTSIWPTMDSLPHTKQILATQTSSKSRNRLHERLPMLSSSGMNLLAACLRYDPNKRITADEALQHPYFNEYPLPSPPEDMPTVLGESERRHLHALTFHTEGRRKQRRI